MAVEYIHTERGVRRMSGETVVIDRHLYLTEDKSRVVEEGDVASRWLWASPGQEMSREEAVRLGAIKSDPDPDPEVEVEPEVESKVASKPADKAMRAPENKAATESGKVREWAAKEGLDVPARGRIPADVLAAYRTAHED